LAQGCPSGRMFGETLAAALVLRLATQYSVCKAEVVQYRRRLPQARLQRAIDYIHAHLLEDTSLNQLRCSDRSEPASFRHGF
jgi:AraC family transcriptional regulator